MSQRLKQYLNDVMDDENTVILEMSKDLCVQARFQSMIQDLNIYSEQTLECCLTETAAELLKDSMNTGYLVSLLLFSRELDSFHSTYSAWYRRDMLIETLHNIFLAYTNRLYKKYYHFLRYPIVLLAFSLVYIYCFDYIKS